MTAVSSACRGTESRCGGCDAMHARSRVAAPATGPGAAGSAVMMTRCGQPLSSHAARAIAPIGSSARPLEGDQRPRVAVAQVIGDLRAA